MMVREKIKVIIIISERVTPPQKAKMTGCLLFIYHQSSSIFGSTLDRTSITLKLNESCVCFTQKHSIEVGPFE